MGTIAEADFAYLNKAKSGRFRPTDKTVITSDYGHVTRIAFTSKVDIYDIGVIESFDFYADPNNLDAIEVNEDDGSVLFVSDDIKSDIKFEWSARDMIVNSINRNDYDEDTIDRVANMLMDNIKMYVYDKQV